LQEDSHKKAQKLAEFNLCGLTVSRVLCVKGDFNAEDAEIGGGSQRKLKASEKFSREPRHVSTLFLHHHQRLLIKALLKHEPE
jgi:hypothetical protein